MVAARKDYHAQYAHAIVCLVGAGMWRAVPELLEERGWQGRWKRKQQRMLP